MMMCGKSHKRAGIAPPAVHSPSPVGKVEDLHIDSMTAILIILTKLSILGNQAGKENNMATKEEMATTLRHPLCRVQMK